MAGLHFDATYNNADVMRKVRECEKVFAELGNTAEIQGKRIDAAFEKISLKSLERAIEIMKNFPKEVQGISSFQKQIDGLEKHIERVNQRIASVGNGKLGSTFSDVSGNVNIGNVLKEQVYVGAQAVNTLSEKIIQQKILIKDVEHDVRTLGEAYRRAGEGTTKGNALFADFKSAKKSLQEEKNALFELQTQQAQARLSVRKLKDEQSLYQKEAQKVVESNESMSVSFKKALGVIGGTAMLKKFVSDVVRLRGEMQQLDVAFTTLLQSKEKANALMAQMVQTAAKTPFNLTELATGAKQLVAYGFASEGVNDTLIRLGNIAAGLGLPLERLTYLYGTTMTQGRLYARDLMQFTTSGIPMLQGLADMFGVSTDKVNEMVTAGKIGFPEVQKVIENMTNEGGKFFNLMEEQSKTITGKISNLGDAWDEMLNKIGQSQEGTINASIDGLKYLIENYETVGKILTGLIATFGVYKAATIAYYAISKTYGIYDIATKELQFAATMKNIAATKALAVQQALLNKTMLSNPYILVATLVVGAAAAMWAFHDSTTAAEKAQSKFNDELDKFKQKEEERKQKIESLIRTIQDETETEFAKVKAYQELQRLSPALTDAYKREELAVASLADTNKELNKVRDVESYDNIIANIKKYTEYVNRLSKPGDKMKNVGDMYSGMVSEYGVNTTFKDRLELAIEDLKKWQDALDEYKRLKKEAEENAKPVEVKLLEAKNNREQILQEFLSAEMTLKEEQRKIKDSGCGEIPIWVEIRFENAQKALSNINGIIKGLLNGQSNVTYKEAYSTAEREWKKAQKVLVESKKKSKAEYIAAKKDLDEKEKNFKDLGGVTNTTKQDKAADTLRKEQEKLALLMDKQALDQSRSAEDLQTQVDQARINAMREGSVRTLEQMKLDHSKEMQQLERQQEDLLRKRIEDERVAFDAKEDEKKAKDPKYIKQTFNGNKVTLSQSEKDAFANQKMYLDLKQVGETQAYLDKERQSWNAYLSEYGTFQEKKEAITAEYNDKIANASTKGEKESLKKELENRIKEINLDELKASINFADIFGNLDAQSTEALTTMRDKLKEVIENSAKDLKPTDLKALQDAFKDIDIKVSERNPFGELKQGVDDYRNSTQAVIKAQEDLNTVQQGGEVIAGTYLDATGKICTKLLTQEQAERNLSDAQRSRLEAQAKLNKSVNTIGQQGQQIVQAGNDLTNMLTDLGVSIPDSVKGALDGVGQVMDSMANIDLMKPMSILTGITGMLAGIGKTIGSIFGGSSNGTKVYEDMKEQLSAINEIYDRIIDKSKEEIVFGAGFASVKAAENALDTYYKKVANYRQLAEAGGNAGGSGGSHRYVTRANERLEGYWGDMSREIGTSISSMWDMYNLSGDQLDIIRTKFPEAWSKIPSEITDSLNAIADCKNEAKELTDTLNAAMTGIDTDSFYNGFIDSLSDMDTSFEDMCDNFEGYLRKSIIAGLVSSQYQDRINSLYQDWSKYAQSGKEINEDEARELQNRYKEIVSDMMKDREEMANSFGWESSTDDSREASKKGFASMSQDSADELNGRFTVIQGHTYEINGSVKAIQSDTAKIAEKLSFLTNMDKNMSDMVRGNDVIISHLSNIEGYTENLVDIRQFMYSMKLGIDTLNTKGITLKR